MKFQLKHLKYRAKFLRFRPTFLRFRLKYLKFRPTFVPIYEFLTLMTWLRQNHNTVMPKKFRNIRFFSSKSQYYDATKNWKNVSASQNQTTMVPKKCRYFWFSIRIKILWCTKILKNTCYLRLDQVKITHYDATKSDIL